MGIGSQISTKKSTLKGFNGPELVFWPYKWPKIAIFNVTPQTDNILYSSKLFQYVLSIFSLEIGYQISTKKNIKGFKEPYLCFGLENINFNVIMTSPLRLMTFSMFQNCSKKSLATYSWGQGTKLPQTSLTIPAPFTPIGYPSLSFIQHTNCNRGDDVIEGVHFNILR